MNEALIITVTAGEYIPPEKLQKLYLEDWGLEEGKFDQPSSTYTFIFRRPHERRNGSE